MSRRHAVYRWSLAWTSATVLTLLLAGCPDDPYDPQTWIEKLDDPTELDNAITQLQRLADPVAIKPLSNVWSERGRPQRVLRAVIELAEHKDESGNTHWADALPVLRTALDEFDVGDNQSIENAKLAADALGRAGDKESIQSLVNVVNKSMPRLSPGQEVRRSAIIALGKFGDEPRSVDTLVGVLKLSLEDQPVELFAAAANALADSRSSKAVLPLLTALYKIPPIYDQCRRALIAIGKPVIPELIKIFKEEHKELNALAKENKFNIDCKQEMGPETSCIAPTNLQFKAATLLGDLYAKEAAPVLVAGLSDPALPAFFAREIPGPTQHAAILDALRKINDPSSVKALGEYWRNPSTDDMLRPLAIDVYSMVASDTDALSDLAKLIKDDDQEEQIRMAAGQAYGRLVRDAKDYDPLQYMANRYKKEADKREKDVKKAEEAVNKAKKAFEQSKGKDTKAQQTLEEKQQELAMARGSVAGYRGYQRAFEQHMARGHAAASCKQDPKCYAAILDKDGGTIAKEMGKYIDDLDKWTDEEKRSLQLAASERALIELAKMGEKGRPAFDKVLEKVISTERIIRQGGLLALVHIAALPCDACVKRLDEIIKEQQGQSTLNALTADTKAVRNYFWWAGK